MIVTLKGKQAIEVQTFAEASKVVQHFRDTADYGFAIGGDQYSRWQVGRIFEGSKQIAHVSYNGRIWQGTARQWNRDTQEIIPEVLQ